MNNWQPGTLQWDTSKRKRRKHNANCETNKALPWLRSRHLLQHSRSRICMYSRSCEVGTWQHMDHRSWKTQKRSCQELMRSSLLSRQRIDTSILCQGCKARIHTEPSIRERKHLSGSVATTYSGIIRAHMTVCAQKLKERDDRFCEERK